MPLAYALSTWPQAQPWLEQVGHVKDPTWVEQMLDAATVRIEHETGATFVQRSFTERRRGGVLGVRGGAKRIYLDHYPVVSVTSITDEDSDTVAAADYRILEDLGALEHDGRWPVPTGEWSIVYTAGRYASTDAVAEDVRLACNLLVSHWIGAREDGGGSVGILGLQGALPSDVKSLLTPYQSRSV